ncbi:hypothetical protein KGF54_005522 [Candida jiufengensis]|uniref:uncharacterized protein n=1 Tax=Candida jiufengensis TaxID=497108 RepID=UPI0022246F59|nr:uncharacterized protein KGF54_005522 [Candida jiufengensis]KAI5949287.1 hypothetical protein KGF54_005522 [Candida jiufengensis]
MQSRNDEELSKKDFPFLNTLPLGSELRDAIIAVKGIENVNDLIDKINHKNQPPPPQESPPKISTSPATNYKSPTNDELTSETRSIESENSQPNAMVDEDYDKLSN